MNMIRLNEIPKLIVSIVICQLAGLIGSVFTTAAIPTWYVTLNKPFLPHQIGFLRPFG
jgi:benzodiazapine receptor